MGESGDSGSRSGLSGGRSMEFLADSGRSCAVIWQLKVSRWLDSYGFLAKERILADIPWSWAFGLEPVVSVVVHSDGVGI